MERKLFRRIKVNRSILPLLLIYSPKAIFAGNKKKKRTSCPQHHTIYKCVVDDGKKSKVVNTQYNSMEKSCGSVDKGEGEGNAFN